jgi:hypothetical protein
MDGRFVAGADRSQTTLFPDCLDDLIDEDSPYENAVALRSERNAGSFQTDSEVEHRSAATSIRSSIQR